VEEGRARLHGGAEEDAPPDQPASTNSNDGVWRDYALHNTC
jgi:hypothetical protein